MTSCFEVCRHNYSLAIMANIFRHCGQDGEQMSCAPVQSAVQLLTVDGQPRSLHFLLMVLHLQTGLGLDSPPKRGFVSMLRLRGHPNSGVH